MSMRLEIGDTGKTLVNKFNNNASEIEVLQQNQDIIQRSVEELDQNVRLLQSKKHVETKIFSQNNFEPYFTADEEYNYKCIVQTTPISWYFRERVKADWAEKLVYLDSAYKLMPDGSGTAIIFVLDYDLSENDKSVIELVVNYYE